MSDKWTSGPWEHDAGTIIKFLGEDVNGMHSKDICEISYPHDPEECGVSNRIYAECSANARLIAQAPAMAALLRELIYSANGHELPIPLALKLQKAKQLLKDLEGS